jgi:hemolysin activation/secretion protein
VTGRLLAYFSVRGQYGFKNLDTTEQFRLGGPDGVRAFANGEGTGDAGIITTAELRVPLVDPYFGQLARETVIALFFDHGTIRYRRDPAQDTTLAGLSNQASLSGVGLALAWVRPGKYALRFSCAFPMSGTPKGDPSIRDPRFYAQLSTLF